MTYRWQGHFSGDPAAYRDPKEVEDWKNNRCPIKKLREKLSSMGVADAEFTKLEERALEEVVEMVEYARSSPLPKPEDAMLHVYAGRKVELHNA